MDSAILAFSLGPAEIGALLVLMLFIFGPKRIPEMGKSLGEALTSFKKATREANEEVSQALAADAQEAALLAKTNS